jgi:hypothetical protein
MLPEFLVVKVYAEVTVAGESIEQVWSTFLREMKISEAISEAEPTG